MSVKRKITEALAAALDIPPSYYKKASDRYEDLGNWFRRPGSLTEHNRPHLYGQGSFRLGTVIRPLTDKDSYDLDVGCRLEAGISKLHHSQKHLKQLVGKELEAYRKARQIESPLDEKHRCWRLEYADELPFHMDVVPSIPGEMTERASLASRMELNGLSRALTQSVASHSGNITDNRHPQYEYVAPNWRVSNSEGYALWFESRMTTAPVFMKTVEAKARSTNAQKLPLWEWKSPLQQAIQILKRHRDTMFRSNPDQKPISIILTTLAAKAYGGQENIVAALEAILSGMDNYISNSLPRIPNPVNPSEDFADKWSDHKYAKLDLEGNFRRWLTQARADLKQFDRLTSKETIEKFIWDKFRATVPAGELDNITGLLPATTGLYSGVQIITERPARPWSDTVIR